MPRLTPIVELHGVQLPFLSAIRSVRPKIIEELQLRVKQGSLLCEYGHPIRTPELHDLAWQRRADSIELTRVCARIQHITVRKTERLPTLEARVAFYAGRYTAAGPIARVRSRGVSTETQQKAKPWLSEGALVSGLQNGSLRMGIRATVDVNGDVLYVRTWDLVPA